MNLGWVASKVKVCHLHAEVGLLWRLPYLPRVLVSISASFLPSSGFSNPRVPLRQLQSVPWTVLQHAHIFLSAGFLLCGVPLCPQCAGNPGGYRLLGIFPCSVPSTHFCLLPRGRRTLSGCWGSPSPRVSAALFNQLGTETLRAADLTRGHSSQVCPVVRNQSSRSWLCFSQHPAACTVICPVPGRRV